MKIAIITFQSAINYGAVLQVYALSGYLKQQGHEPTVIQYCPTDELRGVIKNRFGVFGLHPADYINVFRRHAFRAFRKRYIPETQRRFDRISELNQLEGFDAYICGSDQIWNAELTGGALDPAYFLSFAKAGTPKIAYAASTGGNDFGNEAIAANLLKCFTSISVREASLAPKVAELSGQGVVSVLDPTLLPVDYSELVRPMTKKFILLYALQEAPGIYRRARQLSKMTGLPLINLGARVNQWKHPGRQYCCNPQDFVSLFKHASLVVTNSFHGTVFSTIFQRPLFSCALEGAIAHRNVRMVDYLANLGLSNRFFQADVMLTQSHLERAQSIDWEQVTQKMEAMRVDSVAFLNRSLAGEK